MAEQSPVVSSEEAVLISNMAYFEAQRLRRMASDHLEIAPELRGFPEQLELTARKLDAIHERFGRWAAVATA